MRKPKHITEKQIKVLMNDSGLTRAEVIEELNEFEHDLKALKNNSEEAE